MMKRQRCSVPMSLLPDDVITDILSNLPVKSVYRFRSVSKSWCCLFSNPNFIKLHLNHAIEQDKSSLILQETMVEKLYLIDYDSLASSGNKPLNFIDYPFISFTESNINIRGYCIGLFCCSFDSEFHIWNPSTNEYKTLPKPPNHDDLTKFPFIAASTGLGYDCKLDDYKFLVNCSLLDGDNFFSEVLVHSLGSASWNIVKNIPYKVLTGGHGVFLNGALHWIGTRAAVAGKRFPYHEKRFSFDVIVSFDMVHETVKDVPLPKELKDKFSSSSLSIMRDHLCIFDNNQSKSQTQVWVMNGGGGSWTKLLSIQTDNDTPFSYLRPIKCFKNGLMLLRKGKMDLVLYDQEHKTFTKLNNTSREIQAISYVGSLVSLNSTTYFKQQFGSKNLNRRIDKRALRTLLFDVIVSFDMVHETVKDVPLPKELKLKDGSSLSLSIGVMRDHLCIFDNNQSKSQTQVWVMKEEEEENGGGGSWAKLFSIQTDNDTPFSYFLKPIKCFKNGLMLLRKGKTDLVLYDQKHKTFTKLIYTSNEIQAISYVESLVSLNSTTYFKQQFGNVV